MRKHKGKISKAHSRSLYFTYWEYVYGIIPRSFSMLAFSKMILIESATVVAMKTFNQFNS